jgi:rhodanese-related sulfurtransferase
VPRVPRVPGAPGAAARANCRRYTLGGTPATRRKALYRAGHVPGAHNLPHGKIVESALAELPPDTLFVVYCAGPHCNGAHRGAIRLARLGQPVKLMIGGVTGWLDEGFALDSEPASGSLAAIGSQQR